ncbi:hypothetical protein KI387_037093, partial [Taxus chinensis]
RTRIQKRKRKSVSFYTAFSYAKVLNILHDIIQLKKIKFNHFHKHFKYNNKASKHGIINFV